MNINCFAMVLVFFFAVFIGCAEKVDKELTTVSSDHVPLFDCVDKSKIHLDIMHRSDFETYPYLRFIGRLIVGKKGEYCTASRVSRKWILTGAHCVLESKLDANGKAVLRNMDDMIFNLGQTDEGVLEVHRISSIRVGGSDFLSNPSSSDIKRYGKGTAWLRNYGKDWALLKVVGTFKQPDEFFSVTTFSDVSDFSYLRRVVRIAGYPIFSKGWSKRFSFTSNGFQLVSNVKESEAIEPALCSLWTRKNAIDENGEPFDVLAVGSAFGVHSCSVGPGNSGSPLFVLMGGYYTIVALDLMSMYPLDRRKDQESHKIYVNDENSTNSSNMASLSNNFRDEVLRIWEEEGLIDPL